MKEQTQNVHRMTLDMWSGFRFAWGIFLALLSLPIVLLIPSILIYIILFVIGAIG